MKVSLLCRLFGARGTPLMKEFELSEKEEAEKIFEFIKSFGFEFNRAEQRYVRDDTLMLEFIEYQLNDYYLFLYTLEDGYVIFLSKVKGIGVREFNFWSFISQLDDKHKDTALYHIDLFN